MQNAEAESMPGPPERTGPLRISLPNREISLLGGADDRANFIVILTDDQRVDTVWAMPKVLKHLARPGITFKRGFVSNSLCCPSRVAGSVQKYTTGGRWQFALAAPKPDLKVPPRRRSMPA